MRTMLKVSLADMAAGNRAISDGSIPKTIQSFSETAKPEASYFFVENGVRTALFVFDMKDASEIPGLLEPFFMNFNAKTELIPVMNGDELQRGLEAWMKIANK